MSPISRKLDRSTSQVPRKDSGSKSVDDVNRSEDAADSERKRRVPNPGATELPPNENLDKDADEAYGDTEIPHRNSQK